MKNNVNALMLLLLFISAFAVGCTFNAEYRKVGNLKLCIENECNTLDENPNMVKKEELLEDLYSLLNVNEGETIIPCWGNPETKECKGRMKEFVQGGPIPGVVFIKSIWRTDAKRNKERSEITFNEKESASWMGIPIMASGKGKLMVRDPNNVRLQSGNKGVALGFIPGGAEKKLAIDYIDFDKGILGGELDVDSGGFLAKGFAWGYALYQFPMTGKSLYSARGPKRKYMAAANTRSTQPVAKATSGTKEPLVMMPIRLSGVDAGYSGPMEAALVNSLQAKYQVFSGEQVHKKVREIFTREAKATEVGKECDETRCMQDIAIAFQTELIATAQVMKNSGGYIIALSIRNIFDDTSVYSNSIPCKGCDEFQVIDRLKIMTGL
ncbi:MAG: hypothetical protein IMF07_00075 [Proteobacteria bacterium]|nr:hypothetical protein [Pseudomonadota bacterium]